MIKIDGEFADEVAATMQSDVDVHDKESTSYPYSDVEAILDHVAPESVDSYMDEVLYPVPSKLLFK